MPRCCSPIQDEFEPCYASVLVDPDIKARVMALEKGPLVPSFTAWCSNCRRPYLLTNAVNMFKRPSAHHAHMLVLSSHSAHSSLSD
jgi:hypothetical protein